MKFQEFRLLPLFTILILLFAFSLISPTRLFARSGCCSYHGGVCGCGCCDGTSLSSTCAPYYPECGGGSVYVPPPTCPLFSSYNSISEKCECYSGYIASGSQCISQTQACQNQLGFSSRYNSLTGNCECSYGYIISGGKCTYASTVCSNKYGYSSTYDSSSNNCKCNYGYKFNLAGTKCISNDEACQEQFGSNSKATLSGDKCECKSGYKWQGNVCVWDTPDYESSSYTNNPAIPTSTPKPTLASTSVPKKTNTPVPTPSPVVQGALTQNTPTPTPTTNISIGKNIFGYAVLGGIVILLIRVFTKKDKKVDIPNSQV